MRAQAELGTMKEAAVLIVNRPLKEPLEKRAYQMYIDNLHTTVDQSLPEERRWPSIDTQAGWDSLSGEFSSRKIERVRCGWVALRGVDS